MQCKVVHRGMTARTGADGSYPDSGRTSVYPYVFLCKGYFPVSACLSVYPVSWISSAWTKLLEETDVDVDMYLSIC